MLRFYLILASVCSSYLMFTQNIRYNQTKNDSLIIFNLVNKTPAPLTFNGKKTSDLNISLLDTLLVCPPMDSITGIFSFPKKLRDDNPDLELGEHLDLRLAFGVKLKDEDIIDYKYELPFLSGRKYKIMQGFNGRFSHQSDQSRYAIDFAMPIGDTIVAARSGYVVNTKSHFTERGGKSFRSKANQIVIYHDDGTLAFYVHLDTNGVLVNVGDYVEVGDKIGIAGFTGYTTKPHLHFVVRNFRKAIPIEFKEKKGIGKKSGVWAKKKKRK
ncbi:MAG: M23 family metallopeptidase [Bacteroidota bacterium]